MRFLLLVLALLLPAAAHAQLNGFYTIGGSSPDYATISAAVADLNAQGVSGPTRFAIRAGTYTEQISIDAITGTSAADTVQFRAANSANRPTIQFDATAGANYVWRIADSDHVKLRDLDFVETGTDASARILEIEGGSDNLSVDGCTFTGLAGANDADGSLVWSDDNPHDHLTFDTNTFTQGYLGLDLDQEFVDTSTSIQVTTNTFDDQQRGAIDVAAHSLAVIDGNTFASGPNAGSYAGIVFSSSDGEITNNVFDVKRRGLFIGSSSTVLIANNFVALEANFSGDDGMDVTSSADADIFHNTIYVYGSGAGQALKSGGISADGANFSIRNNLLINESGGPALSFNFDGPFAGASDYNDLYTTGATLVEDDGTNYANLTAYQSATGLDPNSVSVPVTFADATNGDLHLTGGSEDDAALLGTGTGITEDIDGDLRSPATPRMGADEGVSSAPLEGTYSVGLAGISDFANPFEAIDALNTLGTGGPVLFNILAFDYTGNATIEDFPRFGAPTDPVIFRGNFIDEPGFPRPTLRYAGTSGSNFIIRINGADFVSIEDLEFEATGASIYGRLIVIEGDADDLSVTGCTFDGLSGSTLSAGTLVYTATNMVERLTVADNKFNDGYRGLRTGLSAPYPEGHVYHGNTFTGQYNAGIYAVGVDGAQITENLVIDAAGSSTSYTGILGSLGGGTDGLVARNVVNVQRGARGISLGLTTPKLVANNFVTLQSPNGTAGIELGVSATRVKAYHNTVYVSNAGVALRDLDSNTGNGTQLRNNILMNAGGGLALEIADDADVNASDYNNLYTTGPTLVSFDGVSYATLANYQAGSSRDANSVSKAVTFADAANGDLHLTGPSDGDDDLGGTSLAEVPEDIDGEDRGVPPYMGADEASGLAPPVNYDLVATNTTPLVVAPGGSISFSYSITNNTANPATGNLWFVAKRNGNTVAQGVIVSGTLPGGQTFNGTYTQNVPGNAPVGAYTYDLNIGNFPGLVVDTEAFSVTVDDMAHRGGARTWSVTDVTPWPTFDETEEATEDGTEASSESLPETFALEAAYPNPFARSATVGFALPEAAAVRVSVYDVLGREVAVLVDGELEAGRHAAQFEAAGLASGVYLVRMVTNGFAHVQRVTLAH